MAEGGIAGRSSTPSRISRPARVSTPTSPRAVEGTAETTTSCLARPPPVPTGSSLGVRASSPVEESSTKHGSSATSSGAAAAAPRVPADSSSTVRRGVPNFLAISAELVERPLQQPLVGEHRVELLDLAAQLSCSFSSSIRENRVSRRSGISRM